MENYFKKFQEKILNSLMKVKKNSLDFTEILGEIESKKSYYCQLLKSLFKIP